MGLAWPGGRGEGGSPDEIALEQVRGVCVGRENFRQLLSFSLFLCLLAKQRLPLADEKEGSIKPHSIAWRRSFVLLCSPS